MFISTFRKKKKKNKSKNKNEKINVEENQDKLNHGMLIFVHKLIQLLTKII